MGPIEFTFIALLLVFGAVGVVRGASRELGVTNMLLIGLLLIKLLETQFRSRFTTLLNTAFGVSEGAMPGVIAVIACSLLIIVAFISYQGATLTFPIRRETSFFGLGLGLINGYLFAGSLWYYLQSAGWPLFQKLIDQANYTLLNRIALELLPPKVFDWKTLIFIVIALLILRVWK